MEIWTAAQGDRWRCSPCSWEGDTAEFRLEDHWQPDGPPLSFAACPQCGKTLDHPTDG
jgi:hypothetical protein